VARLVPLLNQALPLTLRAVTAMTLTNLGVQQECAIAIAEQGGVSALVQCMGPPTDDVLQEKAASALWNLSAVESTKDRIRTAGGIPFLISVFEFSSFVPSIENCLGTLLSLAETQENRYAISQSGAVGLLIRLMDSSHPAIVEKSVGVIWNLAHEDAVQHTVRQLGGLKPIIDLLTRQDSPLIRFNAVGAFPLLTEQEENVQDAFELGIIPPLVNLLATETNVLLLQNTAHTLGNIAECGPEYQTAISDAQGLYRLMEVICRWSPDPVREEELAARWSWANRQELLAKCCYAAWLICQQCEVNQIHASEVGGVSALVGLLGPDNDETLLEMAAGAVCALCESCDQNKDRFREELGLQPLIVLLDHESETVKLNAAKALCHLSENEENRRIIRELGGLDRLVNLLAPPNDSNMSGGSAVVAPPAAS
jgi:hypothetical protein